LRRAQTLKSANEVGDLTKEISIIDLASTLHGKVVGNFDEKLMLCGTCAIENYAENKVSFIRKTKYGGLLAGLRNAVVLIPESLADLCEEHPQNTYIIVEDILNSMMDIQDLFYGDEVVIRHEGVADTARVAKSAQIGHRVYIGEHVCIGKNVVIGDNTKVMHNVCVFDNVTIGSGTVIYPGVCIYHGCRVGSDCVIHAGVVIGTDGFRYEQFAEQKTVRKMLHMGRVTVGDRVEIGANTAIDRATFEEDATIISDDVKIDNLVHIAHNVKIGPRSMIVTQSCIGGSTRIGEDVWIGIGAAISNGLSIGDRAKVLLNAVVAYDVKDDEIVSGFYAMPHKQWKQIWTRWTEQT
jgi:UDP-3-O-[3-hydroxymyristoyl] glucosamine N-acyltransferase